MRLNDEEKQKITDKEKEAYLKEAMDRAEEKGKSAGKYHGEHWLYTFIMRLINRD